MNKEDGFWSFFCLSVALRWYTFKDYLRTVFRYYRNLQFAKIDVTLLFSYFWTSPYYLSRKWAETSGYKASAIYGETPLMTMEKIAKEASITKQDVVYELGSGRGRCVFWLQAFIGCRVVGVECNPIFIENANAIKERFHLENTSFILEDVLKVDFKDVTVIYLYLITLSDSDIIALAKRLAALPNGTRIITISFSLTEYDESSAFQLVKEFEVEFPWGKTDAYLNCLVSSK